MQDSCCQFGSLLLSLLCISLSETVLGSRADTLSFSIPFIGQPKQILRSYWFSWIQFSCLCLEPHMYFQPQINMFWTKGEPFLKEFLISFHDTKSKELFTLCIVLEKFTSPLKYAYGGFLNKNLVSCSIHSSLFLI